MRLGRLLELTAGEIGTFRGGSGFPLRYQGSKAGRYPFFKVSDMNDRGNEIHMRTARHYISEVQRKQMGAVRMPEGAIVMAKVGAAVFLERKRILSQDSCIDNNMAAFVIDPAMADVRFVHYLLTNFRISSLVATTALPSLNASQLRSIPLLVPDQLEEQREIVDALVDVDELIAALERNLAKKRDMKQGVLQQLLTGETRLAGFNGAWRGVEVAELLEFTNGLNKASQYFGSGTPIVNFMDVMRGPMITTSDVVGRVTLTRDEVKRFSAKRGDLFFTRTSETIDEVGTAAVLVDEIPNASFSGFILRGRPRTDEIDPRYVAHLFQLDAIRRQITSSATYTTRALTNGRSLGKVSVDIPGRDEQRAIANLIADLDSAITALRARTAKAKSIKQGMMQELLTGRTRLPVAEEAA